MDNNFVVTVNKTLLDYCLTIPKEHHNQLNQQSLVESNSIDICITWGETTYSGKLYGKHRLKNDKSETHGYEAYQLHFDNELLYKLKKTFIQSYILIQSQIYEHNTGKQYRTEIPDNIKEKLKVTIQDSAHFIFEIEERVKTPYDNVFKNLLYENVFCWMGKGTDDYKKMITKSSDWISSCDIKKYCNTPYVIYYLVDDIKKHIYIGSAQRLGDRVKLEREEIPGWNKFRFEIVHENHHGNLKNIEYHSIINFSKFLKNNGNKSTLGISDYILVNKDYGYFRN